jgi:RHS repeat-associated protein
VVAYDDYDPWGYILPLRSKVYGGLGGSQAGNIAQNKFTGNEFDDEFGLNWGYHIDRFYDHQVGRWWVVDPIDQYSLSPYVYGANNPLVFVDPFGADTMKVDWLDEKKKTAHYIPEIVVEAKRERDEGVVRPRPGRLFGLGFLAVGEALGHNDFYRAYSGTDPFTTQRISGTERAIATASATLSVLPTGPRGWMLMKVGRPLRKMGHAFKHLKHFQKLDPNITEEAVAKILEYVRMVDKNPITQANGRKAYSAMVEIGGQNITVEVVEKVSGNILTGYPVGIY